MTKFIRRVNNAIERLFGVRFVKTQKLNQSDELKAERAYWANELQEFYRNTYNLEMHPIQTDDSIVPPLNLIEKVQFHMHATPDYFFAQGYRDCYDMFTLLNKYGVRLDQVNAVLDFGVAFGRLLVNWYPFNAKLYGCDITPEGARWSQKIHGERAQITITKPAPPLPYENNYFDIVYANAVIIHIPYLMQDAWIQELYRIVKPGGFVVATYYEPSVNLKTWPARNVNEKLYKSGWLEMPGGKDLNYNAVNTFLTKEVLSQKWGKEFNILDHCCPR